MKDFQNFYRLSWITLSILIEIQPNFNTKWALYNIIDGANLAEFEVGEGRINKCCEKEENTKKFGRLLEPRISGTAGPIPFKFDTQGNETVGIDILTPIPGVSSYIYAVGIGYDVKSAQ